MTNLEMRFLDCGLRHDFVAKKCGVTRQTIYNWLKGTHRIPGDKLVLLADLLSCQPRDLIGFAEVAHEICV